MKTYLNSFIHTLKEAPRDAETSSHQLMVRTGMIQKVASGIYTILPLGMRVFKKTNQIIREEMKNIGGVECEMPHIIPAELWKTSGRWGQYGKELLRISDRADREFCFGPTHEEVITDLIGTYVNSYKQLPVLIYQIQTKFRDEIRPRFGLMRSREFLMKDAYSFHETVDSLNECYSDCRQAYVNIFNRCGLKFIEAKADSGAIGGDVSAEFLVIADTGEDEILLSEDASYAANSEIAVCIEEDANLNNKDVPNCSEISTPNIKTIDELVRTLSVDKKQTLKSVLIMTSGNIPILLCIRGDRDLNEIKIKKVIDDDYQFATDADIKDICNCNPGFIGPKGLKKTIRIIFDLSLKAMSYYICGANKDDVHLNHVVIDRDLNGIEWADIRKAKVGDPCPIDPSQSLVAKRGIEVGHVFKLGNKYSKEMNTKFTMKNGQSGFFEMGCYGIGVGRTIAAAIEQSHDNNGIIWPKSMAPYHVVIINLATKEAEVSNIVKSVYSAIEKEGVDVIVDNRHESAGVKFKDADLIGIPFQIIIGKRSLETKSIELKHRSTGEKESIPIDSIDQLIQTFK